MMMESAFYSWEDDLRLQPAIVRCNGDEVRRVTQCQTGENGWLERIVTDDNDRPVLSDDRELQRERMSGNIEVEFG